MSVWITTWNDGSLKEEFQYYQHPSQSLAGAFQHPIKSCEQVVLTPQIADQTAEGVDRSNEGAVENVVAFLEGRPRNNVAV